MSVLAESEMQIGNIQSQSSNAGERSVLYKLLVSRKSFGKEPTVSVLICHVEENLKKMK